MRAALNADRFGRRYSREGPWAVRDVTFSVPAGSITGLVGPNGAGKSTLIRSWIGFERPDEGRVMAGGIDPQKDRVRAIAAVAYMPQANALYRQWTIDEHFRWVKTYRRGFDYQGATKRVGDLGLSLSRPVSGLSGGEKAQVAVTIALSLRTPILLLDEPMASLDPLARRQFLAMVGDDVRRAGSTVILSSHVIADLEQICDSILVLSAGRLLLEGQLEAIRGEHMTVPAATLDGREPISTFVGPTGENLALLRASGPTERHATLEEIVFGYLATVPSPRA